MMNSFFEEINCDFIREQMRNDEKINLNGKILIVSDRLKNIAESIIEYIENITNANILGFASSINEIESYASQDIDYIIIIGYLLEEKTYLSVKKLYKENTNIKVVQWALQDAIVDDMCLRYDIIYRFERHDPLKNFMMYLIDIGM